MKLRNSIILSLFFSGSVFAQDIAIIPNELNHWNDYGPHIYSSETEPQNVFISPNVGLNHPNIGPILNTIGEANSENHLDIDSIKKILAQAITQSQNLNTLATIAIVDRVGNVLAVYRMNGASTQITISSTLPATIETGLDHIVLPEGANGDGLAAIAKAITGAYLSSSGNAFSTRTAGQIIQEHFNPGEDNQPAGPLFGVQFSQLPCSDFNLRNSPLSLIGPQRSPLGLSADSGGFPLYKNGEVIGGVGVISDNHYGIDKNILNYDDDKDEIIALAATQGFEAPIDVQANRITVDGKTLRYSDVHYDELSSSNISFDSIPNTVGQLIPVNTYFDGVLRRGAVFADSESGIRSAIDTELLGEDAYIFVNEANQNRFSPMAGTDAVDLGSVEPLTEEEVVSILQQALSVANKSRAQIRRPLGSQARVTISVVDTQGEILGMVRSKDAPVFGSDVSIQKARTAALFSNTNAADFLNSITTPTNYFDINLMVKDTAFIPDYVTAIKSFVGVNALSDGTAFSDRAGGNLSRPFYADGLQNNPNGPLSKSFRNDEWSVFSTGLQSDLIMNKLIQHVLFAAAGLGEDAQNVCTESVSGRIANGIQIFPGSVPIYRGDKLIGGIGVSGDGVDQDDMIAFLGLHNASVQLNQSINNAPPNIRADNLTPQGVRLRYIQCPQSPFIQGNEQNVCRNK